MLCTVHLLMYLDHSVLYQALCCWFFASTLPGMFSLQLAARGLKLSGQLLKQLLKQLNY